MRRPNLNDKQKAFANEYLVDKNCTQACIRAGYSKKTAYSQGQRLLKNVEIRALIDKKLDKIEKKVGLTAERAMEEVAALATSNIKDILDYDPATREMTFKTPDKVPARFWQAAQEITVLHTPEGNGTAYKVKMHPKIPALRMDYERLKLIGPDKGVTNNIMMQVNALEYNRAMRRIGEKDGE